MGDGTQENASSKGAQGDGTSDDADKPKYVTEEQLNRAITARLENFGKKQSKEITEALSAHSEAIGKVVGEQIGKAVEGFKAASPDDKGKSGKDKDKTGGGVDEDPRYRELQTKLADSDKRQADLEAKYQKSEAEKKAAHQKSRDDRLRQKTFEELQKQGLDATRARLALGHIVDAQKLVRYADDDGDQIVFGEDGDELGTGLKAFFKTPEGKVLLPPKGTRGSGDGPGSNNTRTGDGDPKGTEADWANIGARLLGGGG